MTAIAHRRGLLGKDLSNLASLRTLTSRPQRARPAAVFPLRGRRRALNQRAPHQQRQAPSTTSLAMDAAANWGALVLLAAIGFGAWLILDILRLTVIGVLM